ncbi:MAG: hypothetical protein JO138_18665 [Acidobacteriaceae bacterium]|nr:hypothetical protein [Acidobacteriaceae bacterium]
MYLFHLFRSLLPVRNPIGFGASDFILIAVSVLFVFVTLLWPAVKPYLQRLADNPLWCMLCVGALPVLLRLALLPSCPVPVPSGSDDFSYLLLADTLSHFRLANPPHPFHQFFETIFVLQQPTYSSIYPLGQGLVLTFGLLLFNSAWTGVLLSIGAFSGLCYWMLRAWTTPQWALLGAILAGIQFGPLSYWTNSYWGGAVSASAGCLAFGALPRLQSSGRKRDAIFLGLGIAIQLLTRPFESALLSLSIVLYLVLVVQERPEWRRIAAALPVALLAVVPAIGLTLMQNKAVTGSWTTLPYVLNRYEYGVPTTFTFQANPIPHRQLTSDQELDYRAQSAVHGDDAGSPQRFASRLAYRARFGRFFLLPALYVAFLSFLVTIRERRFAWVMAALAVFALGTTFFPYFYPHYIAAVTCLFVLGAVLGLQRLSKWKLGRWLNGVIVVQVIVLICLVHFGFWYGVHLLGDDEIAMAMSQYETWDFINYGDPEGRIAINQDLTRLPGKQLVFVRYGPRHMFHNWIHNRADIDTSRIIWARDLGPAENEKLLKRYPDRTAWLIEPDRWPPQLRLYEAEQR